MRILSIDVGSVNCAFYIEEFDEKHITESSLFQGKKVFWSLQDFTKEGDVHLTLIRFLEANMRLWNTCNGIIVEKQLGENPKAQALEVAILTFFRIQYGQFKYISSFPSTKKTQVLNAPLKMDRKQRKKWAVSKAEEILIARNDIESLSYLAKGKADDKADAMLQLLAFVKMIFIQKVEPVDGGPRKFKRSYRKR